MSPVVPEVLFPHLVDIFFSSNDILVSYYMYYMCQYAFRKTGYIFRLFKIIGECPGVFTAHTEVIRAVTKTANSAQP